jgi:C4-dicarboxylate-binding protein DctP
VTWNILDTGRPASDLLDMVGSGELTLCYFSTSYLGSRVPELNVLEIPFLFQSLEEAHTAIDGELGRRLTRATEAATPFAVLGYWDNGFRHFTNRLRPVTSPEDCIGMRVRLQPNQVHEAMIEAWGGTPVAVELSEGVALIKSGAVDAQENPLANTVAYGVDKVHHHISMTGHLFGARGLYAHRATVASWPDEVAAAVQAAVDSAIGFQRTAAAAKEEDLRRLLEERGTSFVDLDTSGREAFRKATSDVIATASTAAGPELVELAGSGS